jgi:RNA polymerase sigma-70 factor (ECF subfamily)
MLVIRKARSGFSDRFAGGGHERDVLLDAALEAERELAFPRGPERQARFRELVERQFDFVWRNLRRLGVPRSDVDDAAQEVFVVAARRLDDFTVDRERAFLFGTALRVCSTRRRSRRRHPEELSDTSDDHPGVELDPEELADLARARPLLQAILDGMSEEFRAVFVLAELEELPVREIAALLGVPEGTVASRLRTARAKFREGIKRLHAQHAFAWRKR